METKAYELTVAFDEKKTEKEIKETVMGLLDKVGGKVDEFIFWGKKDLIYPIGKRATVAYGWFQVILDPAKVGDLSNRLRMQDDVLRQLIIQGEEIREKRVEKETETKKKVKKVSNKKVK